MTVSWPGTTTWPTGGTPTPADFDTYISQGEQWLKENIFDAAAYGVAPVAGTISAGTAITLGTAWVNIAGGSVTLPSAGAWVLNGCWTWQTTGGAATVCKGQLTVNGTALSGITLLWVPTGHRASVVGEWTYRTAGTTDIVRMQTKMDAGGGGGTAALAHVVCYKWRARPGAKHGDSCQAAGGCAFCVCRGAAPSVGQGR